MTKILLLLPFFCPHSTYDVPPVRFKLHTSMSREALAAFFRPHDCSWVSQSTFIVAAAFVRLLLSLLPIQEVRLWIFWLWTSQSKNAQYRHTQKTLLVPTGLISLSFLYKLSTYRATSAFDKNGWTESNKMVSSVVESRINKQNKNK